jgi:hypothetical protein
VVYNILAFHLMMAPASIAPGLVASVLWDWSFFSTAKASKALQREACDAAMNCFTVIAPIRTA